MADSFPSLLEERKVQERDLRQAIYVKPLGQGIHEVRLLSSGESVNAAGGGRVFRPGERVTVGTGSGSGNRQWVIIAPPPPGQKGTAVFGFNQQVSEVQGPVIITSTFPLTLIPGLDLQDFFVFGYGFREFTVLQFYDLSASLPPITFVDDPLVVADETGWVVDPGPFPPEVEDIIPAGQQVFDTTADVSILAPDGYQFGIYVKLRG